MAKPVKGKSVPGTTADDELVGTSGDDSLYGYEGNDTLYGGGGNDTLYGHEGNDVLFGEDGNDYLAGQEGNDTLDGGAGNDTIGAGPGNDVLTGGSGADRFLFGAPFEPTMNHHTITDYRRAEGDYIDLRSIDADSDSSNNTRKGNTDFTVVSGPSATPGTAWMEPIIDPVTGQQTGIAIYLNVDSDIDAETRIDVLGATSLTWGVDILG